MSVPMSGSGGGYWETRTQMAWFLPLMLCSNSNLEKKRVIGSGENRQWAHSCAQPAENPQILKMKYEKADLWVCDCSVQCGVLGSLAEGVRPLSTQTSPILQLQSKEMKYLWWHIQKQENVSLREAMWFKSCSQCCGNVCHSLHKSASLFIL